MDCENQGSRCPQKATSKPAERETDICPHKKTRDLGTARSSLHQNPLIAPFKKADFCWSMRVGPGVLHFMKFLGGPLPDLDGICTGGGKCRGACRH